jgi:hypothetical protein
MMQLIKAIFAELLSLFVDDSNLALQVLALVAAVTGLVKLAGVNALIAAALLLIGCIGILLASVLRRAKS